MSGEEATFFHDNALQLFCYCCRTFLVLLVFKFNKPDRMIMTVWSIFHSIFFNFPNQAIIICAKIFLSFSSAAFMELVWGRIKMTNEKNEIWKLIFLGKGFMWHVRCLALNFMNCCCCCCRDEVFVACVAFKVTF